MAHNSFDPMDPRKWIANIGDRNERARHILDFGLMHDPDCAELVAGAARGTGYYSQLLDAAIEDPDEPVA